MKKNKHKRNPLFLIFAFVMFGCSSPYAGDYIETPESRKAEIQRRWNRIKPQKTAQTQEELFDVLPIVTGPDYQAGKLKAKYLSEAVDTLNFCRFLAGAPDDVQLKDDYTDNAQHGMVVLAALNRQLNHYPPKPADMDQAFFDKGYRGTSSSNLFWHSSSRGPPYYTPALVVYDAWLDDSDAANRNALGHRRWALNPSMAYTGFGLAFSGRTDSYYAMTSTDTARTSKVDYDAICWPNGPVFPLQCMEDYLAWSITVNPDKYQTPNIAEVKVTVTALQSGDHWDFYQGGTGHFRINTEGYGVNNCIIFTPENTRYSKGGVYRVEVQGLKTKSGEAAELKYQIEFFSLDEEI